MEKATVHGVGLCCHVLTTRRLESLISSSKLKNHLLDPVVVPAFQARRALCIFYTLSDLLYAQAITFSPKYYLFLSFPTSCCFPSPLSSYLCSAFAFLALFLALTLSYFLPSFTFQASVFSFFPPDLSPTLFPAHPAPGPSTPEGSFPCCSWQTQGMMYCFILKCCQKGEQEWKENVVPSALAYPLWVTVAEALSRDFWDGFVTAW